MDHQNVEIPLIARPNVHSLSQIIQIIVDKYYQYKLLELTQIT